MSEPVVLVAPVGSPLADAFKELAAQYAADSVLVIESCRTDDPEFLVAAALAKAGSAVRGRTRHLLLLDDESLRPKEQDVLKLTQALPLPEIKLDLPEKPSPPWKERRHWHGQ